MPVRDAPEAQEVVFGLFALFVFTLGNRMRRS